MATETQTGLSGHLRGVTVTTLACLAGIAAGLASDVVAASATDRIAVFVVAAFVAVQYPVLRVLGVDVADFGVKDHLYVTFMTVALWFISYAILLETGASI
jgi:uncharacterized membrane protein